MLPWGQPGSQGLLPTRGWRMLPEMLLLALPQRDGVRGALLPSQAPILFSVARTGPVCGTEVIRSVPSCSCLTGASCPVLLSERGVPGCGGGGSKPDLKTPQVLEARPRGAGRTEGRGGRSFPAELAASPSTFMASQRQVPAGCLYMGAVAPVVG